MNRFPAHKPKGRTLKIALIQRFAVAVGWDAPSYLSKDFQQELLYLQQQTKSRNASAAENKAFSQSVAQVRAAGTLGDRPLVVLTAAYNNDPTVTDEERKFWIDVLQVEEANLSTRGKQIVVQNTGHMIPFEQPDAVVSAIREVYAAVKSK